MEFFVDSIDDEGRVIGRNADADIPVGTTFSMLRRRLVHMDPDTAWSEDTGLIAEVRLVLVDVRWYGRSVDAVPRGHTAALIVAGDGLERLAAALEGLGQREYISLVSNHHEES